MFSTILRQNKALHGVGNSSLQIPSEDLSNSVLYSSVVVPVLKLRMLKVTCLQGHNVIGKKRQSSTGFKAHSKKIRGHYTPFP